MPYALNNGLSNNYIHVAVMCDKKCAHLSFNYEKILIYGTDANLISNFGSVNCYI